MFFFYISISEIELQELLSDHPPHLPPTNTLVLFALGHAHVTRLGQQWGLQVEALMSQGSGPFTPEPAKGWWGHMTRWSLH